MFSLIEHRQSAGGKTAYVGPTRVRVSDIARLHETLRTEAITKRIQEAIPHLTEKQVLAALQYWKDHPDEIASEIERDEQALDSLESAV